MVRKHADDEDEIPEIEEQVRGWAPCAHTPDERTKLEAEYLYPDATAEMLLFEINMLGGSPTCMVDQWWGIRTKGTIWNDNDDPTEILNFETYIQGDSLILALTETHKRWVARWEAYQGRTYEPEWMPWNRTATSGEAEAPANAGNGPEASV